ncbi:hypothetical protein IFM89_022007, partial [Coptis chinensis]
MVESGGGGVNSNEENWREVVEEDTTPNAEKENAEDNNHLQNTQSVAGGGTIQEERNQFTTLADSEEDLEDDISNKEKDLFSDHEVESTQDEVLKLRSGRTRSNSCSTESTTMSEPSKATRAQRRYLPVYGPWEIDRFNTFELMFLSSLLMAHFLFFGSQGSHIKIYNVEKDWKVQKDILAKSLRWTVTDTSLSPDQRYLVYASMSPFVHIVDIGSATKESHANVTEIHDGLDFSADGDGEYSFGIFSVKFSTDGRELVAGSSDDSIYVYDLVSNKLTLRIAAHSSDVNTVCFADETGHLIYSGSDDNLCKVWDRRCIGKGKPAGVLMGHLEGITFIDSRGDGRYFISNGKDQTIKLWDIRKMPSNASSSSSSGMQFRNYEWDYRWMEYPPRARNMKHPCDQSLSTYRGHSVLQSQTAWEIDRFNTRAYVSQFSADGSLLVAGSQGSHIKIYNVEKDWKVQKDILAKSLRWTVTDTSRPRINAI